DGNCVGRLFVLADLIWHLKWCHYYLLYEVFCAVAYTRCSGLACLCCCILWKGWCGFGQIQPQPQCTALGLKLCSRWVFICAPFFMCFLLKKQHALLNALNRNASDHLITIILVSVYYVA